MTKDSKSNTLRTFRVSQETWDKFLELCKKNGVSASAAIKIYIEKAITEATLYIQLTDSVPPQIDIQHQKIDILIDQLATLREQVNSLDKEVSQHGGKLASLETDLKKSAPPNLFRKEKHRPHPQTA